MVRRRKADLGARAAVRAARRALRVRRALLSLLLVHVPEHVVSRLLRGDEGAARLAVAAATGSARRRREARRVLLPRVWARATYDDVWDLLRSASVPKPVRISAFQLHLLHEQCIGDAMVGWWGRVDPLAAGRVDLRAVSEEELGETDPTVIDDALDRRALRAQLRRIGFSDRELAIFLATLEDGGETLREVGKRWEVSRDRVRRIGVRGMEQLQLWASFAPRPTPPDPPPPRPAPVRPRPCAKEPPPGVFRAQPIRVTRERPPSAQFAKVRQPPAPIWVPARWRVFTLRDADPGTVASQLSVSLGTARRLASLAGAVTARFGDRCSTDQFVQWARESGRATASREIRLALLNLGWVELGVDART